MLFTTTINNHQTRELLEDCNLEELPNVKEEDFLDYIWTVKEQVAILNPGSSIVIEDQQDGNVKCFKAL